ncbi:hypothetical protein MW290_02165 [Aquincola tertiaricarbonis]|uniref:Ice-binding protein C-terminal domain-containing protein n=1 Tax=Aquincola tertiaricarbonis TaxID=391953 RepID=A0ABY4S2J2_AQUTE|nr:PEP-CTERM sorting domain-containing protein [Aquincola tertiaricarbonis]URI07447.1 hypothetical protein MW290_02165 [Aquincola tertiaricarbonis]
MPIRPTLSRHAAALALVAALLPLSAHATYQLTATSNARTVSFLPAPGGTDTDAQNLNFFNQPGATTLQRLDSFATADHGNATARFQGRIGLLKAYAESNYARCCIEGTTVLLGGANATVQGSFYDEVLVGGDGLAVGTPVSYQLVLRLSGTVSNPSFESGANLYAVAMAEARLRDSSSGQEVSLKWDAAEQATGLYTLTLATAVGHTLSIQGMLFADTHVEAGAVIGRHAEVDFYHSAGYNLAPSVAGLNTIGASGTDFLAPVPEPATTLLWCSGLAALAVLGGRRSPLTLAAPAQER